MVGLWKKSGSPTNIYLGGKKMEYLLVNIVWHQSADKLILRNLLALFSGLLPRQTDLTTDYTAEIKHPYVLFGLYGA